MHDLDRTTAEFEQEYEYMDEYEFPDETEMESLFSEEEEIDLAYELLDVTDEEEMDYFLGKLFRKSRRRLKRFMRSPVGRRLAGVLKDTAMKALSKYTKGGGAASIGELLEPELEGLSPEDQDLEVARRLVRVAASAVKKATLAPKTSAPQTVVKKAVASAVRKHAPGLIKGTARTQKTLIRGPRRSGRWVRRGRKIILMDV